MATVDHYFVSGLAIPEVNNNKDDNRLFDLTSPTNNRN